MEPPMHLPGPKAKAIIERDQAVISPSYPRSSPFVMDHGKGTEIWDVDGNRFLDFTAGIAVTSQGQSHPTGGFLPIDERGRAHPLPQPLPPSPAIETWRGLWGNRRALYRRSNPRQTHAPRGCRRGVG